MNQGLKINTSSVSESNKTMNPSGYSASKVFNDICVKVNHPRELTFKS